MEICLVNVGQQQSLLHVLLDLKWDVDTQNRIMIYVSVCFHAIQPICYIVKTCTIVLKAVYTIYLYSEIH